MTNINMINPTKIIIIKEFKSYSNFENLKILF